MLAIVGSLNCDPTDSVTFDDIEFHILVYVSLFIVSNKMLDKCKKISLPRKIISLDLFVDVCLWQKRVSRAVDGAATQLHVVAIVPQL